MAFTTRWVRRFIRELTEDVESGGALDSLSDALGAGGSGYSTPAAVVSAIEGDAPSLASLSGAIASQGFPRVKDFGVLDAVDLATLGPQLLYTPGTGEIVYGAMITERVLWTVGVDIGIGVGVLADMVPLGIDAESIAFALVHPDLSRSTFAEPDVTGVDEDHRAYGSDVASRVFTDPLHAMWLTNLGPVDTAPAAWQANHAYAGNEWTIQNDVNNADAPSLWQVTTPGTSGGSAPTWDSIGTVTDGTAVWTLGGILPTAGSMRLAASVVTPA